VKARVRHVQPPLRVLEAMLTARIHLDDCLEDNGPLLVLPGSHRHGILSPDDIQDWRAKVPPVACPARAGDVLLMRPLLLHASSAAANPAHRRVVHLEFAATDLDGGLEWFVA
jgi:ectoine hydroxylase-related dioxygenase (phytanoyl-CoA dioxygenase family)